MSRARRAGRDRVAERGGEVDDDEEDEVDELRAAGGGAAARDEAGAAMARSLGDVVSAGSARARDRRPRSTGLAGEEAGGVLEDERVAGRRGRRPEGRHGEDRGEEGVSVAEEGVGGVTGR